MRWKTKSLIKCLLLSILTIPLVRILKSTSCNNCTVHDKIDWHDYQQIEKDEKRRGTGEHGVPAYLSFEEQENDTYKKLYKAVGFNAALSDKIALDRAIPDTRYEGCKSKTYLKHLPSVSVIIPFHNEHWTAVLRTVVSVINRSPPHLLKEVILVDDFSSKEFSQPLYDYLAANLTKVRSIHLPRRNGLIRARLAGAKAATAEVLLFLDSHIETNVNWLPPLLEPIAQDYKTCVCPIIDLIQFETFEYSSQDNGARGIFNWEFQYMRVPLFPEDLEHPTEPFKSPVMAGGLFAISSKFFWELGGYDEGLEIWGGEQYDLSFKIWQCGGQLVDTPCSRVGHIFRNFFLPLLDPQRGNFLSRNYKRVAEVWLDEYAQYLYSHSPIMKIIDPGDISKQKALRNKLQCKPFKWFMETIAYDLPLIYPPNITDLIYGEIRNLGAPELCVDSFFNDEDGVVGVATCIEETNDKADQCFSLTWYMDLRVRENLCLDVSDPNDKADVKLSPCHRKKGNQYWKYEIDTQKLLHGPHLRCLDIDPEEKTLFVTKCEKDSKTQKWRLKNVNRVNNFFK